MNKIIIRKYTEKDVPTMCGIWNEVVEDGVAFPQEEYLTEKTGAQFFASQTYCAVAEETESGKIVGLYILHPNNVGRCSHIANASYAVSSACRGLHIGELLVKDCLAQARLAGFRIMQFNAVVATNVHARHPDETLGFNQHRTIKGVVRMKNGHFEDICPYYRKI